MRKPNKRLIHCAECGRNRRHHSYGLCLVCYMRQYNAAHPEHGRQWAKAHPDKNHEKSRRWAKANPDRKRETNRRWRIANPDKDYKHSCRWAKANPDKIREKTRRHNARKLNATIGPVDEAAIYERDKVCIYCGSGEGLTLDHLIPLARGGPHCQDNLAVACRSCNSRKGTKTYEEFMLDTQVALGTIREAQREWHESLATCSI